MIGDSDGNRDWDCVWDWDWVSEYEAMILSVKTSSLERIPVWNSEGSNPKTLFETNLKKIEPVTEQPLFIENSFEKLKKEGRKKISKKIPKSLTSALY